MNHPRTPVLPIPPFPRPGYRMTHARERSPAEHDEHVIREEVEASQAGSDSWKKHPLITDGQTDRQSVRQTDSESWKKHRLITDRQ